MLELFWYASALAKRYAPEVGTATVNALFSLTPALPLVITFRGYLETTTILRHRFNQGTLTLV